MNLSQYKYIIFGLVILVADFVLRPTFVANDLTIFFNLMMVLGLALAALGLFRLFTGLDNTADTGGRSLRDDTLLKTLARMSYADANIQPNEVQTIQTIFKECTGGEITETDIRVAARGDLYENQPFEKHLASIAGKLDTQDKRVIMKALAKVILADSSVSPMEVGFFNEVGSTLRLAPADLTDLVDELEANSGN